MNSDKTPAIIAVIAIAAAIVVVLGRAPGRGARSLAVPAAGTPSQETEQPPSEKLVPDLGPAAYNVVLQPPLVNQRTEDNHVFVARGVARHGAIERKTFLLPRMGHMSALLLGQSARFTFSSPAGEIIVPGETKERAGLEYRDAGQGAREFSLQRPASGRWTLTIEPVGIEDASYAIDVRSEGPTEESAHLEVLLRDSDPAQTFLAKPGDVVFLRAFVAKGGHPITGARWDLRALAPTDSELVIPMYDDGRHADGRANDGISVGAIVAEGDGIYQLRAVGRLPGGAEYIRTSSIEVQSPHDLFLADTIAVNPAHPRAAEPMTLTVTAVNAGTVDTHDAVLEFYVGADKVSGQPFDLKAGESKRLAMKWTPTSANNYDVQLTINAADEPYASNFKNNTLRTVVRVR